MKSIGTQLTTLRRLVDDLLDVSRIATGKLVLSDDIVDVRAAVSRALVACEHAATQKGIALSARLGDAQIAVNGDAVRIEQAFVNVIGNAIKYTPSGGHVSVGASVTEPRCHPHRHRRRVRHLGGTAATDFRSVRPGGDLEPPRTWRARARACAGQGDRRAA